MSKVLLKQGKLIAAALMLLLVVALLPMTASADGAVYIKPEKLQSDPISGTGWSYDGTTLTLSEGYNFAIDSSTSVTCKVKNYGTLVGGVVGCHFTGDFENYGTVENAAFSCTLVNYGRITDSKFNSGATTTNAEGGVIEGDESVCVLMNDVYNYGTIKKCIVTNKLYNYGTLEDADCFVNSSIKNLEKGTLKNCEIAGELDNSGIIESGTVSSAFTNNATGELKGGEYSEAIVNDGTISGGTFTNKIVNNGTISGGTFNRVLSSGAYIGSVENNGKIVGGDFNCDVINYGECESGNFYNAVSNFATINGGNYYDTVANESTINGGVFKASVINHNGIFGGTFAQLIVNSGKVTDCNAVEATRDSINNVTNYTVCGQATLGASLTLASGDSFIVPEDAKLIIPNGVALNVVNGSLDARGEIEVQDGGALIKTTLQAESHNWAQVIAGYNKDSVTEADRETLQNAVAKIDELLASDDLDADTKAVLEKVKVGANELIAYLDSAQDAPSADGEKEPPKTGDERNIALLVTLMLLSAATMAAVSVKKEN